ncbi:MAG: alpha/beta fold hydrolase [Methanoregulaceae archaeon]
MTRTICPVVLVHGWNSHPGIWNRLVPVLKESEIPVWSFDHSGLKDALPEESAVSLLDFIRLKRRETRYTGPLDLICHSMGTGIGRYLIEILDRKERAEEIRQLIGIGPPNNGSALAQLFSDPELGPRIIHTLEGVFVPKGFSPEDDVIVQEFRPGSRTMRDLKQAGIREDVTYRILAAANQTRDPAFFPWFEGKTWETGPGRSWQLTYAGDGVVANSESALPGINPEIIANRSMASGIKPNQYCHILLPRSPEIIQKIHYYVENTGPERKSGIRSGNTGQLPEARQ